MRNIRRRGWLVAMASAAGLMSIAPGSAAAADPWSALWLGQCCATEAGAIVELEVGEVRWSAFIAKNVGLNTWSSSGATPVHLGTAEPRDRSSVLFYPGPGAGSWISHNRPAGLDRASVGPGETAVFRFRVLAPNSPGDHKEYFEPVAENAFNGWLGTPISGGCTADRWCGVNLIYRIRAQEPPRASIVEVPESIAAGSSLRVVAQASDNTGLDHLVASVDGGAATAQTDQLPAPDSHIEDSTSYGLIERLVKSRRSTFTFSPSSCRWSVGDHTLKVLAYDHVNQVDQVSRTFMALPDRDCDGVADSADDCPAIAASESRPSGCPPPSGEAAKASVLYARAGNRGKRHLDKVSFAAVRGVADGARVEAFCKPACGHSFQVRNHRVGATVDFPGLVNKVVPDGTRVIFRAMLPRSRNTFGRQWVWRVVNGPQGPRRFCLVPGLSGHVGCG